MGGSGSGNFGARYNSLYVDDCDVLCTWDIERKEILQPGQVTQTSIRLKSGRFVFLRVDASGGDEGCIVVGEQTVRLSTSPGTQGGLRWWMHCPVRETRVATLYMHPSIGEFTGREASKLRYRSAYLDRSDVAVIRAKKALRRLAGPKYSGPSTRNVQMIPRPYRQRETTYRGNRMRALEALRQFDNEIHSTYERLVSHSIARR
jgi:hypothetical protein